jgi:hypothetical protein
VYDRTKFPDAFNSMISINEAQTRSLAQHSKISLSEETLTVRSALLRTTSPHTAPHAHMAHMVSLTTLSLVRFRFVQDITMEKGGTSVIADGYLVHGVMTEEEALFAFGFGVVRLLRHPPPIDAPTAPNHTTRTRHTHNTHTHSACNWSTICRTPSRTLRSTTRRSSPTAGRGSSPVRDTSRIHFSFRFDNFRFVFRFRFRFVLG